MTQSSRGEFDTLGVTKLWVTREVFVSLSVEAESLGVERAFQGGHKVLSSHTVTRLVEKDWYEFIRSGAEEGVHHHDLGLGSGSGSGSGLDLVLGEGVHQHDLGDRVEGTTGVASIAAC